MEQATLGASRFESIESPLRIDRDTGVRRDGNPVALAPNHGTFRGIELHESLCSRADKQPVTAIRREITRSEAEATEARELLPANRIHD
jgi:hypothetical protein